jgi:hypothetical protein
MFSQVIFLSACVKASSTFDDLQAQASELAALETAGAGQSFEEVNQFVEKFEKIEQEAEVFIDQDSRRLDTDEGKTPIEQLLALYSTLWGERMDWFMVCSFDMLNPSQSKLNAAYPSADSHYFISIVPPGKQRRYSGMWANAEQYGITITSIAAYEANGDILFNHEATSTAQYVDNYGIYGETQFSTDGNSGIENMTIPLGSEEKDLDHNGYWVFIRVYRSAVTDDNTWQEFLNQGLLPTVEEREPISRWNSQLTEYEPISTALEASYFCRENDNRWWGWGAFENPLCALNASGKFFEILYRKMLANGNFETPRPTESDYDQQFSVPTTNGGLWANPTSEYMTVCPTAGKDIVRITGYWPDASMTNTIYMDYMAVDLEFTMTQDAAPYFDKRFADPSVQTKTSSLWNTAGDLHTGAAYEIYVTSAGVTEDQIKAVTGLSALQGPQIFWDAAIGDDQRCVAVRIINVDPSSSLASVDKSGSREDRMADCKALLGKVYPTAKFCSSSASDNSCSFDDERLLNNIVV